MREDDEAAPGAPAGAVDVEAAWSELNLRLQRSKGLCLVFLHAEQAAALAVLRTRIDDAWSWRTAPLRLLRPQRADAAPGEVLHALQQEAGDRPAVRAPAWIELLDIDGSDSDGWEQARSEVLSRLNEWRSWLQAEFRRPLMVALPLAWRRRVVEVAPDLWHVRASSVVVGAIRQAALAPAAESAAVVDRLKSSARSDDDPALATSVFDRLMEGGKVTSAVEVAREMVDQQRRRPDAEDPAARRDLSVSLERFGDAQREAGQAAQALAAYRESLELRRELRRALGDTPGVLRDLSISLERLGDAQSEAGQGAQALAAYRESLELRRGLRRALGDTPGVLRDLSVSLSKLGDAQREAGQVAQALVACRESLKLCRELRRALGDTPGVLRDLSVSLNKLGDAQSEAGQEAHALTVYRESLELRRELRRVLGNTPRVLRDLSGSLDRLGDAQREAGQGAQALAAYRESLELCRELRRVLGDTPNALDDLAVSLERLAACDLPLDAAEPRQPGAPPTLAERRAWIDEALRYRRQLAHAFPAVPRWQERLDAAERLKRTLED